MVAVIIAFLSYVEVIPLWHVNFGIDNDFGNPLDTKITEPRVQTRLCVAERGGFEPPDTFPHRTLSKRVPSTTQPSLHDKCSRLFCGFYPQLEYNTTSSGKNQAYKRGNRAVFARNFLDRTCKAAYGMIYFIKRRAKRRGEKNERSFFIYNGSS